MLQTLLGFAVILAPFVGMIYFENKLRAFVGIFVGTAFFCLTGAVITQYFRIFIYTNVLWLHILFVLLWLTFLFLKKRHITKIVIKTNWYLVLVFILISVFLVSIHYRYTGPVDSVGGVKQVNGSSYSYPFYSDEWIAVSLANYSIENRSLPLVNPLDENKPFPNYLFIFHSVIAYLFLILNIIPLTHYVWLAIANTTFICFLCYLVIRLYKVSSLASIVSVVSLIFITNSGNLPGLWNLLPYNVSLVFLLLGIISFLSRWYVSLGFSLLLTLLFYPPMIIFVIPLIVAIGIMYKDLYKGRGSVIKIVSLASISLFVVGLFLLKYFDPLSLLIRKSLDSGIVYYEPWNVIPIFILPFACIGLWHIWKNKIYVLLLPVLCGILLWVMYIFFPFVFVIEKTRVVVITSIFLVLIAGFGIDAMLTFCQRKYKNTFDSETIRWLKYIILSFVILFAVFHSHFGLWHKLVLVVDDRGVKRELMPAPPVTRYLTDDDLILFQNIKEQRFISPSWKGLAMGVATGNYPLDSKSSTITNKLLRYDDFMKANCEQKLKYTRQFNIKFAYSKPFSCDLFVEIGKSGEGLVLYEIL